MRINYKEVPSNIRLLHSLNYKKITSKSSDVVLTSENSLEFIKNTVYKMVKTCLNDGGVGLAAPQIGILKKIVVIKEFIDQNSWNNYTDFFNVYINPKIIQNKESNLWEFNESCLSVPGASFPIKRYNEIIISYWYYDSTEENFRFMEEKLEGYLARVLLHEYDHLQGISIVDRYKQSKKS